MLSLERLFPRAADYPVPAAKDRVRELPPGSSSPRGFDYSERHLHCLWADPRWRPNGLRTLDGETVDVLDPGRWNLEAGPDFLGARLRLDDSREVLGDVEIHIHPGAWKHHGHGPDPNYQRVVCHVCWFPGRLEPDELPSGCLQVSLQAAVQARSDFSFDQIDLSAYPYEIELGLSPLRLEVETWNREQKEAFLDAAGEARLRKKTEFLASRIATGGMDQVLYQEVLAALGYKHNKRPFRELAARLPVTELRETSASDPLTAYALLLGVSACLPEAPEAYPDPETALLARKAWDIWWKHTDRFAARTMSPNEWRLGLRPTNHPCRRMMAAAHLFTEDDSLLEKLRALPFEPVQQWIRGALQLMAINTQTYWTRRLSLLGKKTERPIALLGRPRAVSILINVLVPLMALEHPELFDVGLLEALPVEPMNQITRETSHYLFGPDHTTALYRSGLRRQGLIHIFYDYVLGGRNW